MLSAVYRDRAWLAESIAFGLAALLFNVCGLITGRMAPGLVLQQSLTGFLLVSLPVLSMNIFVKAPHHLCGLNSPLNSDPFSWVTSHDNQCRKSHFFFSEQWLLLLFVPYQGPRGIHIRALILFHWASPQCCCVVDVGSWWFCLTGLISGLLLQRAGRGSISQGRVRRRKKLFFE